MALEPPQSDVLLFNLTIPPFGYPVICEKIAQKFGISTTLCHHQS